MGAAVERIITALRARGCKVQQHGAGWRSQCPVHEDPTSGLNLAINPEHGKALLKCHSRDCTAQQVMEHLGLSVADLWDTVERRQTYTAVNGYRRYRVDQLDGTKIVRAMTGQSVPSSVLTVPENARVQGDVTGLGTLQAAWVVYLTEGEKTADSLANILRAQGKTQGVAVASYPGTASVRGLDITPLAGKRVVVCGDMDEPGQKAQRVLVERLQHLGCVVEVMRPPEGCNDFADAWNAYHAEPEKISLETIQADVVAACETPPVKVLSLADTAKHAEPVYWAWQDLIPLKNVTVLSASSGVGKSLLAIYITAQLTRGTLPGEFYGSPVNVLYFDTEGTPETTLAPRAAVAGAYLARVQHYLDEDIPRPMTAEFLTNAIRETEARLVVLDVVTDLTGGMDLNRGEQVREFMQMLRTVAAETNTAILAVTHNRKGDISELENYADAVGGSAHLVAVAKSAMILARIDEHSAVLGTVKTNYARHTTKEISYELAPYTYPNGQTRELLKVSAVTDAEQTLREYIADIKAAQREETGGKSKTEQRARQLVELLEANGGGMWHEDICEALELSSSGKANFTRMIRKASPPVVSVKTEQGKFWVAFENVPAPVFTSSTHQLINSSTPGEMTRSTPPHQLIKNVTR